MEYQRFPYITCSIIYTIFQTNGWNLDGSHEHLLHHFGYTIFASRSGHINLNVRTVMKLRFQEKIDKVKEDIKNPCADFLAVEIKYKNLKKDIMKAKRAREKDAEEKAEEDQEPDQNDKQEGKPRVPKRRRKTAPADPEPTAKPAAKAKSKKSKRA